MKLDDSELEGMKILLVDDVPLNVEILFRTLKSRKFEISFANNGLKALELVPKLQPDLILLDVMMPEMDGIETCKRLQADESTRDIPILFITAKTASEDVVEGFKAGGVDYILKPFCLEEVVARVETHLKLRKTLRDKDNLISELRDTQEFLMNSAKMDLLTGLYSRPGLEEILNQEESKDSGKAFSLILADIDHINKLNDEFGMSVGDQVILRTASIMQECVREGDYVSRWSGEEFLILLPDISLEETQALGETIRSRIESEKLDFNSNQISLTLSMGGIQCLPGMKWSKCLTSAQNCLREAKLQGRNKLVVSGDDQQVA